MNIYKQILCLTTVNYTNSVKIVCKIPTPYLIYIYNLETTNDNVYISQQAKFTCNTESVLYNIMVNKNMSLLELTQSKFQQFIQFTNSKIFIKHLNNHQMTKLILMREMLLQIHPIYSKNFVLYSGASLLLYGCTYTSDIDIIIYDMTLEEINKVFGKIIKELNIDFCYFEKNEYKCVKNMLFNKSKICTHHNSTVLTQMCINSQSKDESYIKENIINFGGIYMFNPILTKQFYKHRFMLMPNGSKHYILLDMYSLNVNNKFGFFNVQSTYNQLDLNKFIYYMNKYYKIQLNVTTAIHLISTFCDATLEVL